MVEAEQNTSGTLAEFLIAIDGGVLLVEAVVGADLCLGISHALEDDRFSIVISVSSNAQINFVWRLVSLEINAERNNGIRRGLCDMSEFVVSKSSSLLRLKLVVKMSKTVHFFL